MREEPEWEGEEKEIRLATSDMGKEGREVKQPEQRTMNGNMGLR